MHLVRVNRHLIWIYYLVDYVIVLYANIFIITDRLHQAHRSPNLVQFPLCKNRIGSTIQLNKNMANYEETLLNMTFEAIRRVHNLLFIRLNYKRLVIRIE